VNRIGVLAAMVGAFFLALALNGSGGLETPEQAEAADTQWLYPATGNLIVPGSGEPSGGALVGQATVPAACTNCYITRIVPDLVYMNDPLPVDNPNGTTANYNNDTDDNVWLHHMVIADLCTGSAPLFASGNERAVFQLPAGYGYFSGPGCTWFLNYHLHNENPSPRHVALKLLVTYETATLTKVTPIWLDIAGISNQSQYIAPVGYSDQHTGTGEPGIQPDYAMPIQGKVVAMGGHVHDYGISVSAFNNRLGDWICTSKAGYGNGSRFRPTGGPGTPGHPSAANAETLNQAYHEIPASPDDMYHIQSMTPCDLTSRNSVVCLNDVIRLHSQYNNADFFPIPDAMGIMTMYVANRSTTPPGVPDTDNDGLFDGCDSGDSDGDGFSDRVEFPAGTDAADNCADNSLDNAWPADVNNDRVSDITDIAQIGANFGKAVPPAPPRHNIAPDPLDGFVDISDIVRIGNNFGDGCT
jgi:hypothetical protein